MTNEEFWAPLTPEPAKEKAVTYRLYYGSGGEPLFYSMEHVPGKYIEIAPDVYQNPPTHCQVVDGILIITKTSAVPRLVLSDRGTPCHTHDVSVVVDSTTPHNKWILK